VFQANNESQVGWTVVLEWYKDPSEPFILSEKSRLRYEDDDIMLTKEKRVKLV